MLVNFNWICLWWCQQIVCCFVFGNGLDEISIFGINGVKCEKCFTNSMSKLGIEITNICPHHQWHWVLLWNQKNHCKHKKPLQAKRKNRSPKFHSRKTNRHPKIQWAIAIATCSTVATFTRKNSILFEGKIFAWFEFCWSMNFARKLSRWWLLMSMLAHFYEHRLQIHHKKKTLATGP